MKQPDQLEYKQYTNHERLSVSEFNSLAQSARKTNFAETGYYDSDSAFSLGGGGDIDPYVGVISDVSIGGESLCSPRVGLFSSLPKVDGDDGDFPVTKTQYKNHGMMFVTDTSGVTAGSSGRAKPVGFFKPSRVLIDATTSATIPIVGEWCGPDMTRQNGTVCLEGCGLMCVGIDKEGTNKYAWVVASQQTPAWVCKPQVNISPNTSQMCTVWYGAPGSEVASSSPIIQFKVHNRAAIQWTAGKFGGVMFIHGVRYGTPWECG